MSGADDEILDQTAFFGGRARKTASAPPRVIVIDGPGRGAVLDLVGVEWEVGRKDDCSLPLPSQAVSKRHLRLTSDEDGFAVEDLQSTNGVRINGRRLSPSVREPLCHGDVIEVSDHRLLFLNERASADVEALAAPLDRERIAAEVERLLAELR